MSQDNRFNPSRVIRAPHGSELSTCNWQVEAPLRMLMNNLDPEVAEHPQSLVVYGGYWQSCPELGLLRPHH